MLSNSLVPCFRAFGALASSVDFIPCSLFFLNSMAPKEIVRPVVPKFKATSMTRSRLEVAVDKFYWPTHHIDFRLSQRHVIQDGIAKADMTPENL